VCESVSDTVRTKRDKSRAPMCAGALFFGAPSGTEFAPGTVARTPSAIRAMSINWREKVLAAGIHFLLTAAVAALFAAVIFFVWYPGELAEVGRGMRLFTIVVGVDIALGPLISLVIYSSTKSRGKLVFDYVVVAIVQIVALVYGSLTVAQSRPVFVAFVVDRLEIVRATDLQDAELAKGLEPYFRSRSWAGPRYVAVEIPSDPKERSELTFLELSGKPASTMPRYFRRFETAHAAIDLVAKPMETLSTEPGVDPGEVQEAIEESGVPREELRWLLASHPFTFAAAIIDRRTRLPVAYVMMRE